MRLYVYLDFVRDVGFAEQPELFEFDHIYFGSSVASPVAILYGALGTECFKEFHVTLVEASKKVLTNKPLFILYEQQCTHSCLS